MTKKDETETRLREQLEEISGKIDAILHKIQRYEGGAEDPASASEDQGSNRKEQ